VAAILLLTLRGTPTMYYGDEIGMHNVTIPPGREQDPVAKSIPGRGRDPERTPMQWDTGPNAGFTTAEPWLPLADDVATVNVAAERDDPTSMLSLHRRLIALRRSESVFEIGSYRGIPAEGDLLAYVREHRGRRFLVALNLGAAPATLTARDAELRGRVRLGTHADRDGEEVAGSIRLRGDEGLVIELGG
jgi:alpha-glucosidase